MKIAIASAIVLGHSASTLAWVAPSSRISRPSNSRVAVSPSSALRMASDEFCVAVLGDLHIDPRKMEDYETGRAQWLPILDEAKEAHGNVALCSLGDLGESKNCDHNPANPSELRKAQSAFRKRQKES